MSGKKALIGLGVAAGVAAVAVLFVLPAETGWDPTGAGAALGLTEIADPPSLEQERGAARMARQEVLTLSDTPLPALDGVADSWEFELAPFESIEFKYTMPQGAPMVFRWEGSAPLHYDFHAHPFDGGEELTEGYGIGEAQAVGGRYTPAFDGIHGWYWQNRSMQPVTIRLEASGAMSSSTIYSSSGQTERPLEGAAAGPVGEVAGHTMQAPDGAADAGSADTN